MKLSASRLFDAQKVIAAFTAAKVEGIEDFIQNIAELSDQFVLILRNRASIADNLDAIPKILDVTHNQLITIQNPDTRRQIQHLIPTRSTNFDHPILAMSWQYNDKGDIDIKIQLQNPSVIAASPTRSKVTIVMYF